MSPAELFREFIRRLEGRYGRSEAESLSRIVFEDLVGLTRSELALAREIVAWDKKEIILFNALAELEQGKPVQYVTGQVVFCRLPFNTAPGALIPRPETEELTLKAIRYLAGKERPAVLDIGTGSGCISVSIAKLVPGALVTAVDKSSEALSIARKNAVKNETEVNFLETDFLDEAQWENLGQYDLIISNPPYIPESERLLLDIHVRDHEPAMALFVPSDDPLLFYRKIGRFAHEHLSENGMIMFECHERYASDVSSELERQGFNASLEKDMFGKDRIAIATQRH